MNFIESIVTAISPAAGLARTRARYLQSVFEEKIRRYDSAGHGRRTKNWHTTGTDANTEIERDGSTLRQRSRDMARNNPYARKALRLIPANVVGNGIRLAVKGKAKKEVDAILAAWKAWAESTACDFDDRKNFYAIQRLAMRSVCESGEVFALLERNAKQNIPIEIKLLEADYLDRTKDGIQLDGGGYIQTGIEYNKSGKRVAYWFYPQHPGANRVWKQIESMRVAASDVIHIFYEERPGQQVGAPTGAAAMLRLRDFDSYEDAQLVRQQIAACFSVFISQTEEATPGQTDANNLPLEKVEPGIIEYLQPGKTVDFATPPPVENYDEYSRTVLRAAAAGYEVTYEGMTGDLSNVNFSSGRMGWIEFGRFVSEWQNELMITQLCNRVWEWFLAAAKLRGVVGDKFTASTEWTPPRREMIDPVKEVKGMVEMVRAGLTSWQDMVRQLGFDPIIVLREMAEDQKAFDAEGFKLTCDARYDTNRQQAETAKKPKPRAADIAK